MNNRYNGVLKATGLLGGVQGLNIILNLVRTKIVAVLIGPAGVGLNGIYNETRELLHSTTNLGLDVSGVRDISQAYEQWRDGCGDWQTVEAMTRLLRTWVLLLALFGMLVCILLAAPLSLFTFDDYDHTWGYVLLSPAVAFSTVTCGEMAVLKALRRLRKLAAVSVANVALGLVVSVPIYCLWGIDGVLPALVTLFGCIMLSTLLLGCHTMPWSLTLDTGELRKGSTMLKIGVNFVLCSILTHVVTLSVLSYLNRAASSHLVGLYNSGYTLTMSYAGMVYAAMEQDYFPRLTGVVKDSAKRMETLLRQQDVMLMLVAPMLTALMVALPCVVPLLLTSEFDAVVPMAQAAAVGLLFRAVYLPHAYLPLAAGDNRTFLFINTIGATDILLVIAGYYMGGLQGMGIALTAQNLIDMLLVMCISRWKYGIALNGRTLLPMLIFLVLICAAYAVCTLLSGWVYWLAGGMITVMACIYSFMRYQKGTTCKRE